MPSIMIAPSHLEELKALIQRLCPQATIWAYGSRVDGTAHEGSDLDLVIREPGEPAPRLAELQEAFRNSNIPFLVDIVDFGKLPPSFQRSIEKNYVIIHTGADRHC